MKIDKLTQRSVSKKPLVSCIMPTYNRRIFVPQSIKYFQRQDYPNRELIIIDDGSDKVADLIPFDYRIRYIRLNDKSSIGAKWNVACNEAKGEIIVNWDDDDWYANWRINYQVENLLKEQTDICGLSTLLYYDPCLNQSWKYVYPEECRAWASGGTFCYTKKFWKRNPFPCRSIGSPDTLFVWSDQHKKILLLTDYSFYIALIHSSNSCPKRVDSSWWYQYPIEGIKELLGEDWIFYNDYLQNKLKDC